MIPPRPGNLIIICSGRQGSWLYYTSHSCMNGSTSETASLVRVTPILPEQLLHALDKMLLGQDLCANILSKSYSQRTFLKRLLPSMRLSRAW